MTLNDLLIALLEPIGVTGESHVVGWEAVQQWPTGALNRILKTGVLAPTVRAQSIECRQCDNHCFMEVQHRQASGKNPARAFLACDDSKMQEQVGRVNIPLEHLQQWRVTPLQLARVVAALFGIESKTENRVGQGNIRIGMVKSKRGRRWLSLNKSPLTLELNGHRLSLNELLYFEEGALAIDRRRIESLANKSPGKAAGPDNPSTEKREARKRHTEAMYEDWRQMYPTLRHQYPDTVHYNDSFLARKIAKMEIGQGKSPETIRRRMKR